MKRINLDSCKCNRWKIIKVKFTKLSGRISEVNVNKNDISVRIISRLSLGQQEQQCLKCMALYTI